MNRILNAAKIFVAGIFLCGIFLGGKASAEINQDTLKIFRETIFQTMRSDRRVFHQDILFIIPRFTGELEFLGAAEKDTLKLKGTFEVWSVDETGNEEYLENPFYLVQDKKNMALYFQSNKKWKKITSSVAAANAVDIFATPNEQELDLLINFVKDVTILQENDKQRTLLVKINGEKIADLVKMASESGMIADLVKMASESGMIDKTDVGNSAVLKIFTGYLEDGLRNSDFWYTWTVDKTKWQTVTASFNLSGLIQSIATAALNDTSQNFTSMEPLREMLETLAFYSEFKGYTTFLNPAAKEKLELPKNVQKAKEVKNFTDDN